jgi:ABC-type Fe3+-hydroxamate transport system substrate-binding protein
MIDGMRQVVDQMGRTVAVPDIPKKIISLVPSQTELLYDLDLAEHIVGQTVFCIYPQEHFKSVTKVGGTKKLNIQAIRDLQPDLIIGNKEENELSQIQEMIRQIGIVVSKQDKAEALVQKIEAGFNKIKSIQTKSLKVLYFIWRKPYMVAGRNTFINDMLKYCGLENAITERNSRYPEIDAENISSLKPDVIFLSSEPYPFKEKHIEEITHLCPSAKIRIVDGEMFTWYGSRLVNSPDYFHNMINSLL